LIFLNVRTRVRAVRTRWLLTLRDVDSFPVSHPFAQLSCTRFPHGTIKCAVVGLIAVDERVCETIILARPDAFLVLLALHLDVGLCLDFNMNDIKRLIRSKILLEVLKLLGEKLHLFATHMDSFEHRLVIIPDVIAHHER